MGLASQFIDLLASPEAQIRFFALLFLGLIGDVSDSITQAILKSVNDDSAQVRRAAVMSLADFQIAKRKNISVIKNALEDKDELIRIGAARCLIRNNIKDRSVISALINTLEKGCDESQNQTLYVIEETGFITDRIKEALTVFLINIHSKNKQKVKCAHVLWTLTGE